MSGVPDQEMIRELFQVPSKSILRDRAVVEPHWRPHLFSERQTVESTSSLYMAASHLTRSLMG